MKFICSLIVVEDITRSRHFYETLLKQTVQDDFGENITFQGGFAIHQKSHFKNLINNYPITAKSHSFELYFEDDSLEEIVALLKDAGVTFIHEIREEPWKQKVVRFYDYDDTIVEIGEPMPHVAYRLYLEKLQMNEISKITYLSETMIRKAIEEYSN